MGERAIGAWQIARSLSDPAHVSSWWRKPRGSGRHDSAAPIYKVMDRTFANYLRLSDSDSPDVDNGRVKMGSSFGRVENGVANDTAATRGEHRAFAEQHAPLSSKSPRLFFHLENSNRA